jgi:hypothetical protein
VAAGDREPPHVMTIWHARLLAFGALALLAVVLLN